MNDLLDLAVEAHGGLRRWRELTNITARMSLGGMTWIEKGWEGAFSDVVVTIDPHVQHVSFAPFAAPDCRGLFTPDRVTLETTGGKLIHERVNPRAAFDDHARETPWDDLHLAYFTGYAIWTYLTVPFLLTEPGFVTEELSPWRENGDIWRRLRVLFPAHVPTHCSDQVFYFSPDGLLRRHDYNIEILANTAIGHYTDEHEVFGGISFPTLRRAVRRQPDGATEPDPALVTIDIRSVTVELREPSTG